MKYKIVINEVEEIEVDEISYEKIGEKDGEPEYGYIKTGKKEIEKKEIEIYSQEKENLDVAELAVYINRTK